MRVDMTCAIKQEERHAPACRIPGKRQDEGILAGWQQLAGQRRGRAPLAYAPPSWPGEAWRGGWRTQAGAARKRALSVCRNRSLQTLCTHSPAMGPRAGWDRPWPSNQRWAAPRRSWPSADSRSSGMVFAIAWAARGDAPRHAVAWSLRGLLYWASPLGSAQVSREYSATRSSPSGSRTVDLGIGSGVGRVLGVGIGFGVGRTLGLGIG